jgi:hypothetical protein
MPHNGYDTGEAEMLVKLVESMFNTKSISPEQPRHYRGRHRARLRLVTNVPTAPVDRSGTVGPAAAGDTEAAGGTEAA